MAATSSIIQFPLPALYPDQFTKNNIPHYPPTDTFQTSQVPFQFKEPPPPGGMGHHPYQYQFGGMPGYPVEQQAMSHWNFGAAIQGIVPEPERFGDLCEKGLVPIITTATHEVTTNQPTPADNLPLINPANIKSEPLKILPPLSCETTYVTTSQPLMCHSTVGPCTNTLPTSLDYNYTPCSSDQMDGYNQGNIGWSAELDPFYSSDIRSTLSGHQSNSNSAALPSPWDFYRPSNT
ncbi:uncharacterized protein LOC134816874 [Bolinopsis microptera]|uniref:uncharacterized protein LOC134816874 n=1 Tax=Bolinopsis microptera TaxID=2820187 RepID=UPI00307A7C23